jgi:hypothetical protein
MLAISLTVAGLLSMSQFRKTKALNMFYNTRLKYKRERKLKLIVMFFKIKRS